jgi:hypothetical protein
MYYGGGHLGFPIGIKNIKFVENLPMIMYMNVHWMVLYKLHVFCSDMKFTSINLSVYLIAGVFQI